MILSLCIAGATVLLTVLAVLFFPKIELGRVHISAYWAIALLGATLALACGAVPVGVVEQELVADTAVNPLKILALFFAMTLLSVFLDELGFFRFLASRALKCAGKGQTRLFFLLYAVVSLLTVFTSNDVIILSFTPFICYFAKNAKIDPVPYLAAEFVAANTWSMALLIGNPTNIYLASALGVDFAGYLRYSLLPTVLAGGVSLPLLYLLFRKKLALPAEGCAEAAPLPDKPLLGVGIAHLAACTLLLAVSSYIGLEMWIVSLCAVGSLFLVTLIVCAARRHAPRILWDTAKRAPFALAPFLLSMFVLIVALSYHGVTAAIASAFGGPLTVWEYGAASFAASNLVNNIPMSVLFSSVIAAAPAAEALPAVFATIVGSNLGALFTPVGALAGIMFDTILEEHGVKFGFLRFLALGAVVALPALAASLCGLYLLFL